MRGRHVAIALGAALICAGAFVVRCVHLDADPPHGLSRSRAPYTDEGLKYYQARNRALFGKWRVETPFSVQGHLATSPVPTLVGAGVFKIFGAGRVQARMISVAAGALSVLVLILIGLRSGRAATGFLAGGLAAVDCVLFSYDRLALFESPAVFLALLAVLAYVAGGRARIALAGGALVAAYLTRATTAVVAAALFGAWVVEFFSRRDEVSPRRRRVVFLTLAAVVAAVVLFALFIPGNQVAGQLRERFSSSKFEEFPAAALLAETALRTFSDSSAAVMTPVTLLLGLLAAACGARWLVAPGKNRDRLVFLLWFLAVVASVAFLDYRPTRYYVLMIPAACYLGADVLVSLVVGVRRGRPGGRVRVASWALGIAASTAIVSLLMRLAVSWRHDLNFVFSLDAEALRRFELFLEDRFIGTLTTRPTTTGEMVGRLVLLPLAGLVVFGACLGLRRLGGRVFRSGMPESVRLWTAVLLAAAAFGSGAWAIRSGFDRENLQREVAAAERTIRTIVGDRADACIGGNWAPGLCMGTPYFTFALAEGNGNAWDTFKRFPVTHLVLEASPSELDYMWRTYPREMERCVKLKSIHVDMYDIHLYEYVAAEGESRPAWPFDERAEE
jgi:hypothetical protein